MESKWTSRSPSRKDSAASALEDRLHAVWIFARHRVLAPHNDPGRRHPQHTVTVSHTHSLRLLHPLRLSKLGTPRRVDYTRRMRTVGIPRGASLGASNTSHLLHLAHTGSTPAGRVAVVCALRQEHATKIKGARQERSRHP